MAKNTMTPMKKVLRFVIKKYLESIFDIEIKQNITKELKAPYLILGNHQNNWDGFIMSVYVDEPISFVISDEQFRNPLLKSLLNYINAIPTIKNKIDISTIKRMIKAKNEGNIIGLYPEGNRTWDGKTQPFYYSTAKLIKMLDIPVVFTKSIGGYLVHPRWAKHKRKGKVSYSYELLFTKEEIGQLTVEQIYQKLFNAMEHDEFAYQRKTMVPYRGKRLAEKLEYLIHTCPSCNSMDQMKSDDDNFSCQECGYSVKYTEYGMFKLNDGQYKQLYFDNVRDWNEWQTEELKSLLTKNLENGHLLADENIILKQGERYKALKQVSVGRIAIDTNSFYFKPKEGPEIIIPIDKMDGLNLQIRNQLDIYYNDQLYRLSFSQCNVAPNKWLKALEVLKEELKNEKNKKVKA